MAEITFDTTEWTAGDQFVESKFDAMVNNDQAVDAHPLGVLLSNRSDPADADVGAGKGFLYAKTKSSVSTPYFKNGDNNTVKELLQMPSSVIHGDIFYVDSALNVTRLPAGTDLAPYLKTQGPGANPLWDVITLGSLERSVWWPSRYFDRNGGDSAESSGNDIGAYKTIDGTSGTPIGPTTNFVMPIDVNTGSGSMVITTYISRSVTAAGAVTTFLKKGSPASEGENVDSFASNGSSFTTTDYTSAPLVKQNEIDTVTSVAAGDILSFAIFRDPNNPTDTYTNDIRFHGVRIDYFSSS